ncbi:MAG: long-chain-fatty-acid--CoA ligase [Solirubrobacteraceae bacterium]
MTVAAAASRAWPADHLGAPLRHAAQLHPDALAAIDGERRLTYRELDGRAGALAGALERLGVGTGERVAYLGFNSLAHLECWLAVPAAARVMADLNVRLAQDELCFIADDCTPRILIADREQLERARALRERCRSIRTLVLVGAGECPEDCIAYERLVGDGQPVEGAPAPEGFALAAICYTGGTTGAPKGVMLSHQNLLANARHNLAATGHSQADRWLHVPPMFHVAGIANVLACTWAGARQVIVPRFEARAFIEAVRRERITHVALVPTMLSMLVAELEREGREGAALPSLRHIQYAASPITPALQRRVGELFHCALVQFYGMTEAAPTVTELNAQDHRRGLRGEQPYARRLGSIGRPVAGVQVEVRGPDGSALPCDQVGELCVRGPNVMLGYWRRPEDSAAALAGGWYRSGDAARRDRDGYLYVVDRLKDMIITGGENVYCTEVEAALASHPTVAEAAVFGIPDPHWGEAVHAVISVRPGFEPATAELIAHARSLIAAYKVPRSLEIRSEPLPKSGPGKVMKAVLRAPFWEGQERRVN